MLDLTRVLSVPTVVVDNSVGAVLASDVVSTEFSVEVMLCFEVDRRIVLTGREGLELGLRDFIEV